MDEYWGPKPLVLFHGQEATGCKFVGECGGEAVWVDYTEHGSVGV